MQFWLYTLKNANEEALMGLIEPHDEPVLEFLTDITVALSQPDNSSFTLKYGGFFAVFQHLLWIRTFDAEIFRDKARYTHCITPQERCKKQLFKASFHLPVLLISRICQKSVP